MTIEEFIHRLDEMRARYPGDAETALEKGAKKMVKAIKKASPVGEAAHPHKLNKSWKCKIKGYRASDIHAEIRSTAPHFHLVNRGFQRKDSHGNVVPNSGKDNAHLHFLEDCVEDNWPEVKEGMAKDFYKKVREHLG
jgi:hypothetical protein